LKDGSIGWNLLLIGLLIEVGWLRKIFVFSTSKA
jgi:hypothetical protein